MYHLFNFKTNIQKKHPIHQFKVLFGERIHQFKVLFGDYIRQKLAVFKQKSPATTK